MYGLQSRQRPVTTGQHLTNDPRFGGGAFGGGRQQTPSIFANRHPTGFSNYKRAAPAAYGLLSGGAQGGGGHNYGPPPSSSGFSRRPPWQSEGSSQSHSFGGPPPSAGGAFPSFRQLHGSGAPPPSSSARLALGTHAAPGSGFATGSSLRHSARAGMPPSFGGGGGGSTNIGYQGGTPAPAPPPSSFAMAQLNGYGGRRPPLTAGGGSGVPPPLTAGGNGGGGGGGAGGTLAGPMSPTKGAGAGAAASSSSASPGAPPPTPGPPPRFVMGARTMMGSYPGKPANQDSYICQQLQPLKPGSDALGPPPPGTASNGGGMWNGGGGGGSGGGPSASRQPSAGEQHAQSLSRSLPPPRTAGSWRGGVGAPPPLGSLAEHGGSNGGGGSGLDDGAKGGGNGGELYAPAGGDAIVGVYDGHGQHGHHVSRFVKDRLAAELSQLNASQLSDERTLEKEIASAHHRANEALKQSGIDVTLSGSTACTALKRGRKLLIANVGDSRAVLGRVEGARLVAKDLSIDQKPDAPAERARIEGGGGHVRPSLIPGVGYAGPARVWDPTRRFGLACSRSMGDTVYYGPNRSGVIAEPVVTTHRLERNDKFVILGSDGVWDRVTSQEAIQIAQSCRDVESASEKIMMIARQRWEQQAQVADDITAVVVALQ